MKKSELKAIIKECIIAEGYESHVLEILEKNDISAWFENSVCYVMTKRDKVDAEDVLRKNKHKIYEPPKIEVAGRGKKY